MNFKHEGTKRIALDTYIVLGFGPGVFVIRGEFLKLAIDDIYLLIVISQRGAPVNSRIRHGPAVCEHVFCGRNIVIRNTYSDI